MHIYIYKIYNDDMAYIGSTKNFKRRMDGHKSVCNNEKSKSYNLFIYQFIRQNGGWDNFKKDIIYECEVKDKGEQRIVEQEWINKNECNLNKYKSYITYEEKKENKKKWQKKYRDNNKQQLREKNKKYYEDNKEYKNIKIICECGVEYIKRCKTQHERSNKHKKFIENKILI